ncbi:MAG: hypothetical protein H7831_14380 [Magnetococcus sp. WYHC-3]
MRFNGRVPGGWWGAGALLSAFWGLVTLDPARPALSLLFLLVFLAPLTWTLLQVRRGRVLVFLLPVWLLLQQLPWTSEPALAAWPARDPAEFRVLVLGDGTGLLDRVALEEQLAHRLSRPVRVAAWDHPGAVTRDHADLLMTLPAGVVDRVVLLTGINDALGHVAHHQSGGWGLAWREVQARWGWDRWRITQSPVGRWLGGGSLPEVSAAGETTTAVLDPPPEWQSALEQLAQRCRDGGLHCLWVTLPHAYADRDSEVLGSSAQRPVHPMAPLMWKINHAARLQSRGGAMDLCNADPLFAPRGRWFSAPLTLSPVGRERLVWAVAGCLTRQRR